ncbi:TIM44-like domain-containing protein [Roseomonas sp. NAR14]|uniref:TIM44-like domain-containing protein n=1 Tax=Roseomonas acroporae TaxID=2937791 RepID=A0A9X1Y2D4_9PROT|nr:TIM44-like domain-containing protein [Roseomonas acroporae]MCK8782869.1 TIM44-like domain-containing protein [Roseomonas acroporae]
MRRTASFLSALAVAALVLGPTVADARPGGGVSAGSRGSRTFSAPPSTSTAPGTARPMERSMTEPSRPGMGAPMAGAAAQPARGGLFGGGFGAGLMGGLIGAGIGGLLFGHGFTGGLGGFASFLGFLLQIALLAGLAWLVIGFFRRRQQAQMAPAGMPPGMAREAMGGPLQNGGRALGGGVSPAGGPPVAVQPTDYEAFERLLKEVNGAWSRQDLAGLQRICTPEMVSYFNEQLTELASRGLRNETADVRLVQGDLAEAWREGRREYATVAMRVSMVDVTRRTADGAVVEGDPSRPSEATELWTFLRTDGGPWMLSAIQQTA